MVYGLSDVETNSKHVVLVGDSLWTTVGDGAVDCLIHTRLASRRVSARGDIAVSP